MRAVALVDERISQECESGLLKRGFTIIKMPPSKSLSLPISSHPDMLIFKHRDVLIASAEYCDTAAYVFSDIREYAPHSKILFSSDAHAQSYPYDAIFNALTIGKHLFCKTDTVSHSLLEYAEKEGLSVHHVNQGYSACTVLPLGDNIALTADEGMALALESAGIEVTRIRNGGISLPPYDYGFIGGSSGIFNNEVYFLGNPMLHPDGEKIISACKKANLTPISLSNEPISDLGRILFL